MSARSGQSHAARLPTARGRSVYAGEPLLRPVEALLKALQAYPRIGGCEATKGWDLAPSPLGKNLLTYSTTVCKPGAGQCNPLA